MVNTRRSESSSVAPENGQRCQTTCADDSKRELGSSCDSINGEQEEEDEQDEEDSWSSQGKSNALNDHAPAGRGGAKLRGVRELHVADGAKFTRLHVRRRSRRSARRHRVDIYTTRHKMRDMMDSDIDDYEAGLPRGFSKLRQSTVERRAALSLRPIMQKSYKDLDVSGANCNSEDSHSSIRVVRRSGRSRRLRIQQSWIADSQMHKVGYPNLNEYCEEDSRDVPIRQTRKRQRRTNKEYIYDYDSETPAAEINPRAESQDKENKEDAANRPASRRQRRQASSKATNMNEETNEEEPTDESKVEENDNDEQNEATSKAATKENKNEKEAPVQSSSESGEEEEAEDEEEECNGPRTRMRTNRKRKMSTTSSEAVVKSYSLRERRGIKPFQYRDLRSMGRAADITKKHPRFNGRFKRRRPLSSDSDSDDSSDSDRRRSTKTPKSPHSKNEQLRTGARSMLPIAPETLDPHITFKSVGGLREHVQCLKEMVLLPMMYPDVFAQFQIQPSRGVLFHGPPGTGKTLLARALANECSYGSKKVSFFMRKGADLLTKWIGESEKQLRMLFEQAAEKKPSIIFFDELDGLAPVRSSRQDQVHASIVSTLLALMDGLTNRGDIIVIGATNRINAIDPALRRPGRFDRELFFPLPSQKEREEILKVHVAQWTQPPTDSLITYLAENSVGYCGSDLKALCSEAVIQSFRRTYPQVYAADYRLDLDPKTVRVEKLDFLRAKSVLIPASHRITESAASKMNTIVQPLLEKAVQEVMSMLKVTFPHGADPNLAKVKISANVRAAQMLLTARSSEYGNTTYLAPALLHQMEHIHTYTLDLAALHRQGGIAPEEACIEIFQEAKRNVPSIIYIPNIDTLGELVSDTVIGIFTTQLKRIGANTPILLLATADTTYEKLTPSLRTLFSLYRREVYEVDLPEKSAREAFFLPLIMACKRPVRPARKSAVQYPELPRASTPPPAPVSQEVAKKLYETEECTLRELRIFLRDICKKLASNKLYYLFTKPVDTEEVPDYTTIIKEPMDLETMMTKVDFHRYECAKDFLGDVELICRNALEYNPARSSADKQIRHRACSLRDYAFALIKSEMDSDFEDKCQEISKRRRHRNANVKQFLPPYLNTGSEKVEQKDEEHVEDDKTNSRSETATPVIVNGVGDHSGSARVSPARKRKVGLWKHGCLKKKRAQSRQSPAVQLNNDKHSSDEDFKENDEAVEEKHQIATTPIKNSILDVTDLLSPSELLEDPLDFDDIDKALNEKVSEEAVGIPVEICQNQLDDVLRFSVIMTHCHPLTALLDLHFQMTRIIKKYTNVVNRTQLTKDLLMEVQRCKVTVPKEPEETEPPSLCSSDDVFANLICNREQLNEESFVNDK